MTPPFGVAAPRGRPQVLEPDDDVADARTGYHFIPNPDVLG